MRNGNGQGFVYSMGIRIELKTGRANEWLKKRHKGTINKSFTPVRVEWTTGSNYIYYGV